MQLQYHIYEEREVSKTQGQVEICVEIVHTFI